MQTFFLEYNLSRLAYYQYGTGEKIMLAFHGFGQHKGVFQRLASVLSNEYTFYSFDLFFHGESYRHGRHRQVSKTEWKSLIHTFLQEKNINEFSLTGFSMGGKFVLATLESFPEKVQQITLLAPDGVNTSFWYSLATYPGWTQNLFKKVVLNPKRFQQLTFLLQKVRLVDKSLVKFATNQLLTRKQRLQVYYSWLIFKELRFNMEVIANIINEKKIPLTLFLGRYDRIITEKNMQKLLQNIKNHHLHILDCGHNALIEKVALYLQDNC